MTTRTGQGDRRAWTGYPGHDSKGTTAIKRPTEQVSPVQTTGKDGQDRTARARKGGQDCQNMTAWTEQLRLDNQGRTAMTRLPGQEGQDILDSLDRSIWTHQPGQDDRGLYIGKYHPPLGKKNISRYHLGEKI